MVQRVAVRAVRGIDKTGLIGPPGGGAEPGSVFMSLGDCCPEHCDCVINHGCRCDHDCVCPDKSLAEEGSELVLSVEQVRKLHGPASQFPGEPSEVPNAVPIPDDELYKAGNVPLSGRRPDSDILVTAEEARGGEVDKSEVTGDVLVVPEDAKGYESAQRGIIPPGGTGAVEKAVVDTPMRGEGGVDFDRVKSGDSVWITVGDPESPLHGRHILISRRPDGLFAISGGMGPGVDERRHYVLTGKPRRSKRDKELEEEIDRDKAYNEPLIAAARELRTESQKELSDASDQMLESLGLGRPDKNALLQHKDDVQNYVADILGTETSSDQAKQITDTIMRYAVRSERKVRERVQRERQVAVAKIGKRLAALRDEPGVGRATDLDVAVMEMEQTLPDRDSFIVGTPNIESLASMDEDERVSVVANHFDHAANQYFEAERSEPRVEDDVPSFEIGESIKPLELKDKASLESAVSNVQSYWTKRAEAEETSKALRKVPLAVAVPSTLVGVRESAIAAVGELSMEEIEQRADQNYEHWLRTNTALAFYDAVGEYWNDDRALSDTLQDSRKADLSMGYHVNSGAATALAALAQEHSGGKLDTLRLIESGNVELASTMVAREAYQQAGSAEAFDQVIENVRTHNRTNQADTERRALERHSSLGSQLQEIRRQQESGELLDRVRGSALELNVITEQQKNLGTALGSLQASATFLDRLEHFKSKREDFVDIGVGASMDDAEAMIENLGLRTGSYNVDSSDPDNLKVRVLLGGLSRHVSREREVGDKHDRYNALKTNMEGVTEDDQGNLVVDSYDVPGWKKTFEDAEGNEQEYKWRVEQRNDIEWLKEATRLTADNPHGTGGGLITRVVGAGKTNTTLGFYANKLAENPDYKALVAVPKGRAEQWVDEANKFSDLNVVLLPEGSKMSDIEDALIGAKPGTIVVTGHREAARAHETLNALQTHEDPSVRFNGLTIDEPQELQARGQSGNVGALGRRLMKVPFDHRIGLTATPARRLPTEAYDLIKWASGAKDLGSKASFRRSFGGFGSGTNAQDAAVSEAYFRVIQPYISGDRLVDPTFKTTHEPVNVSRTPEQVNRQKEIEAGAEEYIINRRRELLAEAASNSGHSLNRGPETTKARRAREMARKEVAVQHTRNLSGASPGQWRQNAKLSALFQRLGEAPEKKHVLYIDTAAQRQAISEMLGDLGYNRGQIKNIASTTTSITGQEMAARVRDFQTNPSTNVIMIDRASASGYNLQTGDSMHILGTPPEAANFLQAQGRVARMPRKGDVTIHTYRYNDAPEEASDWDSIDSQLKVLRASSPGMFSNI